MTVTVNGREEVVVCNTLEELLLQKKIDPDEVAVDYNGIILKKSELGLTQIHEDDCIDIIHFVGGG